MKIMPSVYNYFINHDMDWFGYNFFSRSAIKITHPDLVDYLINGEKNKQDDLIYKFGLIDSDIDYLKSTGFLIEEQYDELAQIKFFYRQNLYQSSSISLIILPTIDCNFDCPYCFEYKKNKKMGSDVIKKMILWLTDIVPNKKKLHISWFGGEPLIEKRIIRDLTLGIRTICNDHSCTYSASLTTNGYLMTESFIDELDHLGISHIQITLDGDIDYHNLYRSLRSGKPSFNKIYENINAFHHKKPKNCSLSIRVNCSDHNYESIFHLLDRFSPDIRSNTSIFFRWIYPTEAKNFVHFSELSKSDKPFSKLSSLYTAAKSMGWITRNPHSRPKYGYCEVDFTDHYLINPDGDLFLCSHTMDKTNTIGNLNNQERIIDEKAENKIARWYTVEPFDDIECLKCKLLPICLGGCRLIRYKGGRACIEEKKSLDEYVISLLAEVGISM